MKIRQDEMTDARTAAGILYAVVGAGGSALRMLKEGGKIGTARDEMHTVAHAFRTIFQASSKMGAEFMNTFPAGFVMDSVMEFMRILT